MKTEMTSKERILQTVKRKPVDHIPMCFSGLCHCGVKFINLKYDRDPFKVCDYFLSLGLDAGIAFGMPAPSASGCRISERTETRAGEQFPLLIKEYETPKGTLSQIVRKNNYERDSISLFDDLNVPPDRSVRYLIDKEEQLDALEYIFSYPEDKAVSGFLNYAEKVKKYCGEKQIIMTGNIHGIGDPLLWMSGAERIMYASYDDPEFMHRYVKILSDWNLRNLQIYLDAGVNYILRRGWYESTDFWSPKAYREFLLNPLKKQVEMAHQAGVVYAYVLNTGALPIIPILIEAGVDVVTNVEPETTVLSEIKRTIGQDIAVCTGVNNYHTIEMGTAAEVDKAVNHAIDILSPSGGFILSPSDSILDTSDNAQRNFYQMIEAWKARA